MLMTSYSLEITSQLCRMSSLARELFLNERLGEAAYILGIKIYRDRSKRISGLSQSTYIDKVLNRFSMQKSKRGFFFSNVSWH